MEEYPLFIFNSFSNWTWGQTIGYCIFNLIALELLGWVIFIWETSDRNRIPPGGRLMMERSLKDWVFIWTNKIGTGVFNYHTFQYCWHYAGKGVYWKLSEVTFFNTVLAIPLFFLAYDLLYSLFHRFLHHRSVYGYVHKHHHKQRAPIYGNDDAINTHPIEFWIGAYLHLWAIWVVPCHMIAVIIFLIAITLMSAFNHTRFEIIVGRGYLYDNREHDTHHKNLTCNYAAYTQFWDYLLGTYEPWRHPSVDYYSYPEPPTPDMCLEKNTSAEYKAAMTANDAPKTCVVTGGSGLVGYRLTSMLIQRGAQKVVSLDVRLPSQEQIDGHKALLGPNASKIEYVAGDICDLEAMKAACKGADCVFHVAALVGPYYPIPLYDKVNNQGARVVIDACKAMKVPKLVMTSSPSTRMRGEDIYDLREDQLPDPKTFQHLQEYARTKALGERACLDANSKELLTCCIGPHQVYGPTDRLFLPSFLETARNGRLRILGTGDNLISFTHTDNCAHAHILAAKALTGPSAAPAGKYYIVTDGGAQYMWGAIDQAVRSAGFTSLKDKFNVNTVLLYPVAYACLAFSKITGKQLKLNPFVVKMCSMHRYFNISNLCNDIGYRPIRSFSEAWPETIKANCEFMKLSYTNVPARLPRPVHCTHGEGEDVQAKGGETSDKFAKTAARSETPQKKRSIKA